MWGDYKDRQNPGAPSRAHPKLYTNKHNLSKLADAAFSKSKKSQKIIEKKSKEEEKLDRISANAELVEKMNKIKVSMKNIFTNFVN